MRKILTAITVFILVLSWGPNHWVNTAVSNEIINYSKVWETRLEDDLACIPVVAEDGSVYGVDASDSNGNMGRLVKIRDGNLIWSSQEEVTTFSYGVWPVLVTNENVIFAGINGDIKKIESEFEFIVLCYSIDGQKVWEYKKTLYRVIPSYRLYNDNVWLVYDNYARVIDPKTGSELHKIDLGPTNPQPLGADDKGDDGGSGTDDFKFYYLVFTQDIMIMHHLNGVKNFKISSDYSLELKWFKKFDKTELSLSNLLHMIQANQAIFLHCDPSGNIGCFDSITGEEKWTMAPADSMFSFYFYNKTHIILVTLSGTSCFDAQTKELLWESNKVLAPAVFNEDIIVIIGTVTDGFSIDKQAELLDTSTGNRVVKLMESDVINAVIYGDDLYLIKENQLIKYTKCNPCVCDLDAIWVESNSDIMESDICPLETKEFSISFTNVSKDEVIECSLESVSSNIGFSEEKLSLEPNTKVSVKVIYTSSMDEPDVTESKIIATSNCGKNIELKLNLKKKSTCKDKLEKICEIEGDGNNLFGDKMICIEESDESGFIALKATDLKTGKMVWSLESKDLDDITELFIAYRDSDSLLCASVEDQIKWFKISVDGKIIWKRTGGSYIYPGFALRSFNSNWDREDDEAIDLFDITTGKNVITGLKFNSFSRMIPIAQIKDKFLFQYHEQNYLLCDAKGKVFWDKSFKLVQNKSVFVTDSLYIARENVSEDDLTLVKLAKVNPETLKPLWSVNVSGFPKIINETKDRIWIRAREGIYCFSTSDGKIIWSLADGKNEYGEVIYANGKICVGQYPMLSQEDEVVSDSVIVINSENGQNVFSIEADDTVFFKQDEKNVYAYCSWDTDDGEQSSIYCIDKSSWKMSWKISELGYPFILGEKTFIYNKDNELSWFEDGKIVGKYKIYLPRESYLKASSSINWDKDIIYITSYRELLAIKAETSSLLWKIEQKTSDNIYDPNLHYIITGQNLRGNNSEEDYSFYDALFTPCYINGNIFISEQSKLAVYELSGR